MFFHELNELLKPSWGLEKWILQAFNQMTAQEKQDIEGRLEGLFANGLPFELKHDKELYLYVFSLMAQLQIWAIPLPIRLKDHLQDDDLKRRLHSQWLNEVFHATVFTKIVYLLSAPYYIPPQCDKEIEKIGEFIQLNSKDKGVALTNLVYQGLIETVFSILNKYNIAPQVFKILLEDKKRQVCRMGLYKDLGLSNQDMLKEDLETLEALIVSAVSSKPKYSLALSAILGAEGSIELLNAIHVQHVEQVKALKLCPSEKWNLSLYLAQELKKDFGSQTTHMQDEISQEIFDVEMTPIKKVLMTQFNNPGDPTMVAEFNVDISNFGFFENKISKEGLKGFMMQAVSQVLSENTHFRYFLNHKKMQCTQGAYVAIVEKLPDCGDHISTIFFRNCHEWAAKKLMSQIERNKELMKYCFKKREQIEREHPNIKHNLDKLLLEKTHEVYPYPSPGNPGVLISDIGAYGYTHAKAPLQKQTGLHLTMLAPRREQAWNSSLKTFEIKDYLPVSISADSRIFDGLLSIPTLINDAFQNILIKPNGEHELSSTDKVSGYQALTEAINHISQTNVIGRGKLLAYLMNRKIVLKEATRIFGDDIEVTAKKLSEHTNYKNLANQLLLDYLGFNAEKAHKDEQFTHYIDKLLNEDRELAYKILCSLETVWYDYLEVETALATVYEHVASTELNKLAKYLSKII